MEFIDDDWDSQPRARVVHSRANANANSSAATGNRASRSLPHAAACAAAAVLLLAAAYSVHAAYQVLASVLIWIASSLLLAPFAPSSATGGDVSVGRGSLLPDQEPSQESTPEPAPTSRRGRRQNVAPQPPKPSDPVAPPTQPPPPRKEARAVGTAVVDGGEREEDLGEWTGPLVLTFLLIDLGCDPAAVVGLPEPAPPRRLRRAVGVAPHGHLLRPGQLHRQLGRPDVCAYNGVYCAPSPADGADVVVVTGIDLNHADIAGYLPDSLPAGLPDPALLHLNSNHFCGVLPDTFLHLRLLDELDLSNNRFVGTSAARRRPCSCSRTTGSGGASHRRLGGWRRRSTRIPPV